MNGDEDGGARSLADGAAGPAWLALREPADAAARAPDLANLLGRRLAGARPVVIHDLGAGTGSMSRWLAPRLPGPQRWILYDQDAGLLEHAATRTESTSADGVPITVETRLRDITRLTAGDLDGASAVTASALLDMLTREEIERIVAACAGAGCPALLTLSVLGRVELSPPDPLDRDIAEAFNDHQRRTVDGRSLLGPDAVDACVAAFDRRGARVLVRPSRWRLGADRAELMEQWLWGWLDAARAQRPDLAGPAAAYARRRREAAAAGRLEVVVEHTDILTGWG